MIKKFHEIGSEYNLSLNLLYSADKTNIEEYFSLKGDQFILLSGGRVL